MGCIISYPAKLNHCPISYNMSLSCYNHLYHLPTFYKKIGPYPLWQLCYNICFKYCNDDTISSLFLTKFEKKSSIYWELEILKNINLLQLTKQL